MTDGFALIKVDGKIAEPITVFINKIAEGIGGVSRPAQIRRVAEAEADAEIIREQTHIEINDLQRRAFSRLVTEEANRQDNIESITEQAIPQLTSSSTPQDMDNDWIMNFFDKCRIVSDEDMQLLWAKLLAGEANSPGTYSKRTINSLASLDKADAELFTTFCCFTWLIDKDLVPFVFHDDLRRDQSIYKKNGIDFGALLHLSSLGLTSWESVGYVQAELNQQIEISYHKTSLRLEFDKPQDNELSHGNALLTSVGKELAQICSSKAIHGFVDYTIAKITAQGITCIR